MLKRIITAAVGLVLFFVVMFSETLIISCAVAIITLIAVLEAYSAFGYIKNPFFVIMAILSSVAFAFGDSFSGINIILGLFIILFANIALLLVKHETISVKDVAAAMFFALFIPFVFAAIAYIRRLPFGLYYVFIPFVGAWMTDSGAYFIGRFFGKHKLAEKISPKKTIEGAVGGLLGAIVGVIAFGVLASLGLGLTVDFFPLLVLGLIMACLAQMGDLFFSLIKRENNIKDFSDIMPGHGGILDRFDSLFLILPFVYVFIRVWPILY